MKSKKKRVRQNQKKEKDERVGRKSVRGKKLREKERNSKRGK